MEDKKLHEEKKPHEDHLRRLEVLVERLERVSDEKPKHPKHPHLEGPHPKHPHPPIPLHERKDLRIDFIRDKKLIETIFEDEDTAKAVIDIITTSPTEIQIVLKVVLDLYNKVNSLKGE